MKNYFKLSILAFVLLIASCKKDNVTSSPIEGNWAVSSFVDNGTDKTSQFLAYDFTFDKSGNMQIKGGSMMSMCNWTKLDSVYRFNMMGMHSDVLATLDDNWMLTNFSGNTCNFIDNNPNRDCKFTLQRK